MSKAQEHTTTGQGLTRRKAALGIFTWAAAGAIVTPAAGAADPVFAAIDAHKAATGTLRECIDGAEAARMAAPSPQGRARVQIGHNEPATLILNGEPHHIKGGAYYAFEHDVIDMEIDARISKLKPEGYRRELAKLETLRAECHADLSRQAEALRNPVVETAEAAADDALNAERDAIEALLGIVPTTRAGILARLCYVAECDRIDRGCIYPEDFQQLLATTIAAMTVQS